MGKCLTDSEFKERVNQKQGDRFEIVSSYHGLHQNIKIKCKKCGAIFVKQAGNLVNRRIPDCKGNKRCHENKQGKFISKPSQKDFENKVLLVQGNWIKVLGKYVNAKTPIEVTCKKCGLIWYPSPYFLTHKVICKSCPHQIVLNAEQAKCYFSFIQNKEFKMISMFKGYNNKVKIRDCLTGEEFWARYDYAVSVKLQHVKRKPAVTKKGKIHYIKDNTLTQRQFEKRVSEKQKGRFKVLSKYISSKDKVKALFIPKHEIKWFSADELLYQYYLGESSQGEDCIADYLKTKKIIFEREYSISNCQDKRPLPFDFAVFNRDGSLNSLIEYQGCQHFINPFQYCKGDFFNKESVLKTQKHDAMKLSFCQKHGIKLIHIDHPQTTRESNKHSFIANLVKRTLDKELKVS